MFFFLKKKQNKAKRPRKKEKSLNGQEWNPETFDVKRVDEYKEQRIKTIT